MIIKLKILVIKKKTDFKSQVLNNNQGDFKNDDELLKSNFNREENGKFEKENNKNEFKIKYEIIENTENTEDKDIIKKNENTYRISIKNDSYKIKTIEEEEKGENYSMVQIKKNKKDRNNYLSNLYEASLASIEKKSQKEIK